ncbi:MAG TPA: hypothetical protein ENI85_02425 [Deltaproteobacteria bacterium]|nr:hypothetical protein [Deltaproteobacteria bacterium]
MRGLGGAATVVLLILGLGRSAHADEDVHEIVWGHQRPDSVRAFVLYVAPQPGAVAQARRVEVGRPSGEDIGYMQLYSAFVSIGPEEYVAVAAIGRNGLMSPLSSWRQAKPSQPGQPVVVEP